MIKRNSEWKMHEGTPYEYDIEPPSLLGVVSGSIFLFLIEPYLTEQICQYILIALMVSAVLIELNANRKSNPDRDGNGKSE